MPVSLPDPLPPLTAAELEALVAALDPVLDGFGAGDSCLDDAAAYLARLGLIETSAGCSAATTGSSVAAAHSSDSAGEGAMGLARAESDATDTEHGLQEEGPSALATWLTCWRQDGGNRQTLRRLLSTLLAAQTDLDGQKHPARPSND